jgi:hypothetical protein
MRASLEINLGPNVIDFYNFDYPRRRALAQLKYDYDKKRDKFRTRLNRTQDFTNLNFNCLVFDKHNNYLIVVINWTHILLGHDQLRDYATRQLEIFYTQIIAAAKRLNPTYLNEVLQISFYRQDFKPVKAIEPNNIDKDKSFALSPKFKSLAAAKEWLNKVYQHLEAAFNTNTPKNQLNLDKFKWDEGHYPDAKDMYDMIQALFSGNLNWNSTFFILTTIGGRMSHDKDQPLTIFQPAPTLSRKEKQEQIAKNMALNLNLMF